MKSCSLRALAYDGADVSRSSDAANRWCRFAQPPANGYQASGLKDNAFPLLVVLDEEQISPQIVLRSLVGGSLEPLSELADAAQVGLLRPLVEPRQLQVGLNLQREWRVVTNRDEIRVTAS